MRLHWIKITLCSFLLSACGANVFQSQEVAEPAEDATIALENQDPNSAIKILETALESDPENPQYISILSMAYAQRAGVEPLTFALNLTQQGSSGDENSSQYEIMFALLPDPTADNLSDINQAVTLLLSIDAENRQPGDPFKLAMFQTAAFVMQTKRFDANLDGSLTAAEVAELTAEDAAVLLNQLDQVAALLADNEDDEMSAAAGEKIAAFQAELDAQPGETDQEKLQSYLASGTVAQ